jgi:hypothetical protein
MNKLSKNVRQVNNYIKKFAIINQYLRTTIRIVFADSGLNWLLSGFFIYICFIITIALYV